MGMFAAIVLIVVVILAMNQMKRRREMGEETPLMRTQLGQRFGPWRSPSLDGNSRALEQEVEALRRRIETLERALTERSSTEQLDGEIERLRER